MKKFGVYLVALVLVLTLMPAAAQDKGDMNPPKILHIYREEVKPGKSAKYNKMNAEWAATARKHGSAGYYLAANSISGPSESWYFAGFPSYAEWERQVKADESNAALSAAIDRIADAVGDTMTTSRTLTLRHEPEASYWGNYDIAKARMFRVMRIRIKPGTGREFFELRKAIKAAHEKANMTDYFAVYSTLAGGPMNDVYIFIPAKSGADMDGIDAAHGKAYQEALGEETQQKLTAYQAANTLFSDAMLFTFNPKTSYADPNIVASDPGFWTPKPVVAATKKPAAVQPAAKKE